jgi:flagellar hook-associated protein 2
VGTAIDGLASGMNTTAMINALMAVEALPQTQLQTKLDSNQSMITALNTLKTKIALLSDQATKASAPSALNLFTATTTSASVTSTATTGATSGAFDLTIDQLAQTKVGVTAAAAWPVDGSGNPAKLTIVDATGKQTEISPATTSMDDVVTAVNAAGAGVTAIKVPAGGGTYRLQLSATQSGAAGDFTAYQGAKADVAAGTAIDLLAQPGAAIIKQAQDATARLYAGTAAEVVITSAKNTFTDVLPGVSVTATATSATPVTITVASDNAAITKTAKDLVGAVNDVLAFITDKSAVSTTGGSAGVSAAKGGIFTSSSAIREVSDRILSAASFPVSNGKSPSEYGVVITRNGDLTFDAAKLSAALAADPAGTQAALQEISTRVAAAAKTANDPTSGTVKQLITGRQSESNDLSNRIADWSLRLSSRRATLQSTFNAMERSLGILQSQQSWLSGQLAGLTSNNTGA